jgi:hypothetical protein
MSVAIAVHLCLKCRVLAQAHQTSPATTTTQQPTFPVEFLGGNDWAGIALIGLDIYLSLGSFQLLLL